MRTPATSLDASFFFDMRRVQPQRGSKDRRLSDPVSSPVAAAELQRRLEAATRDVLEREEGGDEADPDLGDDGDAGAQAGDDLGEGGGDEANLSIRCFFFNSDRERAILSRTGSDRDTTDYTAVQLPSSYSLASWPFLSFTFHIHSVICECEWCDHNTTIEQTV